MNAAYRKQTTLRLPPELLEQMWSQAQARGDSLNETFIRYLLLGLEAESCRFVPHSGEWQLS